MVKCISLYFQVIADNMKNYSSITRNRQIEYLQRIFKFGFSHSLQGLEQAAVGLFRWVRTVTSHWVRWSPSRLFSSSRGEKYTGIVCWCAPCFHTPADVAAYLRLVARTLLSPTTQNFVIKNTLLLLDEDQVHIALCLIEVLQHLVGQVLWLWSNLKQLMSMYFLFKTSHWS